jgi:hypothetical protein
VVTPPAVANSVGAFLISNCNCPVPCWRGWGCRIGRSQYWDPGRRPPSHAMCRLLIAAKPRAAFCCCCCSWPQIVSYVLRVLSLSRLLASSLQPTSHFAGRAIFNGFNSNSRLQPLLQRLNLTSYFRATSGTLLFGTVSR